MGDEDNKKNRKKIIFVLVLLLLLLLCVKMCVDTQNKHSLTIITNIGEKDKKSIHIISGDKYKLEEPKREGYSFDGWSIESGSSKIEDNIFIMGTENAEIIAEWKPVEYKIKFISNNSSINLEEQLYTIETEAFKLPVPSNSKGYTLEGWYDNEDFTGKKYIEIEKGNTGDLKLYAKWSLENYSITYNLNGGEAISNLQSYNVETNSFKINNPTRKGYLFLGWTGEQNQYPNKNIWIEKGTTGDKTYSANWETIEYNIYYNLNGGKVESNVKTYNIETNNIQLKQPTKENYIFLGWVEEGKTKVQKDVVIKKGTTGDKVYTATWEPEKYSISYETNGGILTKQVIKQYNIETKDFNLPIPHKNGYNFEGWYENLDLTGTKIEKISKGTTGQKKYYAKWSTIEYSINYELYEGTQSEEAPTLYTIESDNINLEIPQKEGYNFKGWYTTQDYTGNASNTISKGTTGNKTYYAKWEKIKNYQGYNIYDVLADQAELDNAQSLFVTNAKGIQFGDTSNITNGYGVYTYAGSINNQFPIHYYRGNVDNNNVMFGGICWKAVRTTETGGTKLVYNGTPVNGKCTSTGASTQLKNTKYNTTALYTGSGGYSYGTNYALSSKKYTSIATGTIFANSFEYINGEYILKDKYVSDENFQSNVFDVLKNHHYTCLKTIDSPCDKIYYIYFVRESGQNLYYITLTNGEGVENAIFNSITNSSNTKKSTVRTFVDNWYKSNLLTYADSFEDTIWCNDRTIGDLEGWSPNGSLEEGLHYASYIRNAVDHKPSLACVNKADSFTQSPETGNGSLEYPVGMLTIDETTLSGYVWFNSQSSSYLNNGKIWWTMSPGMIAAVNNYIFVDYSMSDHVASNFGTSGVRPAISLKYGKEIKSGSGTMNDPFVIE